MLGGFLALFSVASAEVPWMTQVSLYIHYIRALIHSKPAFFIAENVKGLMTMANGQVLKQDY